MASIGHLVVAVLLIRTLHLAHSGEVKSSSSESLAQRSKSPYAFYMFENFDLTRSVFEREQRLVAHLRKLRELLRERAEAAKYALNRTALKWQDPDVTGHDYALNPVNAFNMIRTQVVTLRASVEKMKNAFDQSQELCATAKSETVDFPDKQDYLGAVNGMVLLFDGYGFDLDAAMTGDVSVAGFGRGQEVRFSASHNLTLNDLVLFAETAYDRTWYDTAIQLMRKIFRVIETQPVKKSRLEKLKKMRRNLVDLNNQYITKKESMAGEAHKVLPYLIDKHLEKKAKQPEVVLRNGLKMDLSNSMIKENYFRMVCNGFKLRYFVMHEPAHKCHYVHHHDPYLLLGPFKLEVASSPPDSFIGVFHELLTDKEMRFIVDLSKPKLSRVREDDPDNMVPEYEYKSGKKRKVIHKTVQYWFNDLEYEEEVHDLSLPDDNYNYTLKYPLLNKLSKRIELATRMNVTAKYGSSEYQTTNYGLAGLCETHIDPSGYLEGIELSEARSRLKRTGDMIATVMAWIHEEGEEPVGGATAFISPYKEVTIWPRRGSAAFWFGVDKRGFRDKRTTHGGCPVLSRSKWILNKWINYYDSYRNYPCGLDPHELHGMFQGVY